MRRTHLSKTCAGPDTFIDYRSLSPTSPRHAHNGGHTGGKRAHRTGDMSGSTARHAQTTGLAVRRWFRVVNGCLRTSPSDVRARANSAARGGTWRSISARSKTEARPVTRPPRSLRPLDHGETLVGSSRGGKPPSPNSQPGATGGGRPQHDRVSRFPRSGSSLPTWCWCGHRLKRLGSLVVSGELSFSSTKEEPD